MPWMDRAPVLLALDQVNALVNPTGYYDAYSRLLWPESFVVQRELLEFVRGDRKLVRAAPDRTQHP